LRQRNDGFLKEGKGGNWGENEPGSRFPYTAGRVGPFQKRKKEDFKIALPPKECEKKKLSPSWGYRGSGGGRGEKGALLPQSLEEISKKKREKRGFKHGGRAKRVGHPADRNSKKKNVETAEKENDCFY